MYRAHNKGILAQLPGFLRKQNPTANCLGGNNYFWENPWKILLSII